ncbi:filamentous hemagglutinin N-terminal domain-containing protein [Paraburkholderia sp. EG304]|uniref:two-partner secretion domain-containing protein n=1 Tax=Paraburkholderia sp. EG304 TaxID=3237015 RepID=UPI00397D073F
MPPPLSDAQIVPSGAHAPIVISTANGLPQVNVNKPSGGGVSLNTYSQFDVGSRGAVLNNSPVITSTQLAGQINGNPNFGPNDAAKIIVNQVNSNNPSLLRGAVEVAGQKASVVISNSSGLVIDGGGFINTTRGILTTGNPLIDGNGNLTGFNVTGGTITVQGAGFNASNIDQVDLIARAVQANAAIYAKTLNVVTGANQVDYASLNATPIAGTGAAPAVSIDVSQLGGMYANSVFLVGNEKGVGVANAGTIAAQAGDLTLTTSGQLVNTGRLTASGKLGISAASVTNSGAIAAQHDTTISAGSVASTGLLGAGVNDDGSLAGSGNLSVTSAGLLSATGQNVAAGNVTLYGVSLDLSGAQTWAASALALTATGDNLDLVNASTGAGSSITANAAGMLDNSGGTFNAPQLAIQAGNLANRNGTVTQTGTGDTAITVGGALDNTQGTIQGNSQNLTVTAASVANHGGTIYHAGSGRLGVSATGTVSNAGGTIGGKGAVAVSGGAVDNTAGTIGALGGNLSVASGSTLSNDGGTMQAAGSVLASATGALSNAGGDISALGSGADTTLSVSGQTIDNSGGKLLNAGTGDTNVAATKSLTNDGGPLGGNGGVTVSAPVLSNRSGGQVQAGGALTLDTPSSVDNTGGNLIAGGRLTLNQSGASVNNTGGQISGAQILLATASLDNTNGRIANPAGSGGDITIAMDTLTNAGGSIASDQDLSITATTLTGDGKVIGGREASLSLQGDYTNDAANQIAANRKLSFTTTGTLTNNGSLSSAGNVTVNAANVVNAAGAQIVSGNPGDLSTGATTVNAAGNITNAGAIEGNTVTTTSQRLANTGALIGNSVTVNAGTLDNSGEAAVIAGVQHVNLWVSDTLTNENGAEIFSLGDMNIAANGTTDASGNLVNPTGTINNLSSTIESQGDMNVAANRINNVWQNVQTTTSSTTQSYLMTQLPWWSASQANMNQQVAYYVNPADIVSVTPVVTPDGYVVQKVVVNLPANASVFGWMQNGLTYQLPDGGQNVQYMDQSRVTPTADQVTLYVYGYKTGQSNPDQAGGTAWPQYANDTAQNVLGTITYSNQYGDCTTNCIRLETYPGYTDPNTQILTGTQIRLPADSPYQIETERQANETITTTTLAPTSGQQAMLTAGGNMKLMVGTQLNNDNGAIAAGGNLSINGQALPTGDASDAASAGTYASILNTATQLTTTYSFLNSSGYPNIWTGSGDDPPSSWQQWTNPSITYVTGSVGGTITSGQALTISGGQITNTSVQAVSGPSGASAAALGLGNAPAVPGRDVNGTLAGAPSLRLPSSGLYPFFEN